MVMEGVQEDMGDGSNIQCVDHPFKSNTPGGICAFCLQEKLGKLVSSSFPIAVFPSSSSSTSPSFRSAVASAISSASAASTVPVRNIQNLSADTRNVYSNSNNNQCQFHHQSSSSNNNHHHQYNSKRSRLAFLLVQKKKKNKDLNNPGTSDHRNIIFKRSKSTATPCRDVHFPGAGEDYSSQKRTFWPFLYLTKHSSMRKSDRKEISMAIGALSNHRSREKKQEFPAVEELNESPKSNQASFDRKVSRSRSVGCGSRSFSGDFFERISTGFGDCTLRRVESQREGKPKSGGSGRQDGIKERVKCGGLFSGFMITSSSSSSSSSSNWISSSTEDNVAGKAQPAAVAGQVSHGRSKSWGWAFASPIRAFSRPSGKRVITKKNTAPNLAAIPSLLAVRS
ncbi:hypothetical protein LguiB_025629 [Lonicera macranthoides]